MASPTSRSSGANGDYQMPSQKKVEKARKNLEKIKSLTPDQRDRLLAHYSSLEAVPGPDYSLKTPKELKMTKPFTNEQRSQLLAILSPEPKAKSLEPKANPSPVTGSTKKILEAIEKFDDDDDISDIEK